uniref:Peptidyl-prolyl cis-trans isomerase CYP95-like n=1 Tax=Rhizophora mucronata TaxID=61149 RepID=A0A2P2L2D6_RHIMU
MQWPYATTYHSFNANLDWEKGKGRHGHQLTWPVESLGFASKTQD